MLRRSSSLLGDHDGRVSFEPAEFLVEDFSVDEFIQNKRTQVPLDVLRDDLGGHLKFLRSSLIELINQDYGQFVNLSSNLVGLDGRIQNIAGPLQRAKNDLSSFVTSVDSCIMSLKQELGLKASIRQAKRQLQVHRMALLAIESSERHMRKVQFSIKSDDDIGTLSLTCGEIAHAQFLLQNCQESPISCGANKRLHLLMNDALNRLNVLFKENSVKSSNTSEVPRRERVINILLYQYVELQKVKEAENIFMLSVLKPVCDEILSKRGNFSSLLDEVENFLLDSPTINVSKRLEECTWLANYDFLLNCVLPQVIGILKKNFPHIWSPSNPDAFHSNWIRCEKFIQFLEEQMPSRDHLKAFRESETLIDFLSKWQFPVYFQLRFHSLAIELESALDDVTSSCANSDFKLDATRVLVKVLSQCWDSEKIYIQHIAGRFLRASALVVSRYLNAIESEVTASEDATVQSLMNIYCDLKIAELIVQQLISEKLQDLLKHLTADSQDGPNPSSIVPKLPTVVTNFFQDFQWQRVRDLIENWLIKITLSQSSSNISQVSEVPRLYRRTNRDLPVKHGDYVEAILQPVTALKTNVEQYHQGELWDKIGFKIIDQITQRYKSQVDEVLISVQRMEESLKRLKKVKGQSMGTQESSKALSDDDKIRRQIQIDINYFSTQISTLCSSVDVTLLVNIFDKTNGTS